MLKTTANSLLSQLVCMEKVGAGSKHRTKVYQSLPPASSAKPTHKFSTDAVFRKKPNSAFTLLELLLVTAIFGVLILSATTYFSYSRSQYRISKAAQDIQIIRKAAAEWVLNQPDYKGGSATCTVASSNCISMSVLNAAGLLPQDLSSATNPWGSTYVITPATNNPTQLAIGMILDPSVCTQLLHVIAPQAISVACTGIDGGIFSAVFG